MSQSVWGKRPAGCEITLTNLTVNVYGTVSETYVPHSRYDADSFTMLITKRQEYFLS